MSDTLNLQNVTLLVADPSDQYRAICKAVLYGFGAQHVVEADDEPTLHQALATSKVDALVCSSDLPPNGAKQVVRRIRADRTHPRRSIPIIVSMSNVRRPDVHGIRDAGANFVVIKPFSATVLYDRLLWVTKHHDAFWESESYYGPDRRIGRQSASPRPQRRASDGLSDV